MIRADWATPPDGDFARYVDQLMARAAQARLQASATPVPRRTSTTRHWLSRRIWAASSCWARCPTRSDDARCC